VTVVRDRQTVTVTVTVCEAARLVENSAIA
jgi:hypothetical protein